MRNAMWLKWLGLSLFLIAGVFISGMAEDVGSIPDEDTTAAVDSAAKVQPQPDRVIVTYFHGTRRCATCRKLEAYSREAIEQGFADGLAAGTIEWRTVNFDEETNEHYVDDYQLYTKSLILSHVKDGKEMAWKNLDQIWQLVGDKDKYIEYVQKETAAFVNGDASE